MMERMRKCKGSLLSKFFDFDRIRLSGEKVCCDKQALFSFAWDSIVVRCGGDCACLQHVM